MVYGYVAGRYALKLERIGKVCREEKMIRGRRRYALKRFSMKNRRKNT